jgi:hypothetical protein
MVIPLFQLGSSLILADKIYLDFSCNSRHTCFVPGFPRKVTKKFLGAGDWCRKAY